MTDRARLFNWPALLRAGLGHLRLKPDEFWALAPVELMLMLRVDAGSGPLDRRALESLCQRFPDAGKEFAKDDANRGPEREDRRA